MTKSKTQRIIAILLAVAAVALIVLGIIHMPQRDSAGRTRIFCDALRIRTLLNATGEGVVESYVAIAKAGGFRQGPRGRAGHVGPA